MVFEHVEITEWRLIMRDFAGCLVGESVHSASDDADFVAWYLADELYAQDCYEGIITDGSRFVYMNTKTNRVRECV